MWEDGQAYREIGKACLERKKHKNKKQTKNRRRESRDERIHVSPEKQDFLYRNKLLGVPILGSRSENGQNCTLPLSFKQYLFIFIINLHSLLNLALASLLLSTEIILA